MKKRGQARIITIILIILIIIVAIAIVWNVVNPLIGEKSEEIELSEITTNVI